MNRIPACSVAGGGGRAELEDREQWWGKGGAWEQYTERLGEWAWQYQHRYSRIVNVLSSC